MFKSTRRVQALDKKGVSNLVASVLLIVFAITMGLVIIKWSGGLVGGTIERAETKIGSSLECGNVNIGLEPGRVAEEIIIKNNNKNGLAIKGFLVRFVSDDKAVVDYANDEVEILNFGAMKYNYDTAKREGINGNNLDLPANLKTVEIIPKIDLEGEIINCETKKRIWKVI